MSQESAPRKESAFVHLLAGASAGMISDICVHPVDTVRARLQTQKGLYKGMRDAFPSILRKEGFLAFYKGVGIVWAFTTPAHALYFASYELSKKILSPTKSMDEKGPLVHFLAGIGADIGGSLFWVPMDVVKQRLQVQQGSQQLKYKNSLHATLTIAREEGIRGLYRGFGAGLLTYAPFVGIYFALYEQWKRTAGAMRGVHADDVGAFDQLSGAFVTSAVAAAITCPLDVVKTNMQVFSVGAGGQHTIYGTIKELWRHEGISAFGRGMTARVTWIAPGTAITMVACSFGSIFSLLTKPEPQFALETSRRASKEANELLWSRVRRP